MTTIAYTSVAEDGRTFDSQLILSPQHAPADLPEIARAVHKHSALLCFQLTHAGGFASRELLHGEAQLAPSSAWDVTTPWRRTRAITLEEMDRIKADFVAAAETAVGFGEADAVEVHLGHGYLLSQWLCPWLNWRTDGHGGSAAARLRWPLEIVRAVRTAIGPNKGLIIKLNVDDGFWGGVTPEDVAVTVAGLCAEPGLVDAIVPSAGFVSRNGFFMLRGTVPRPGMARALARSSVIKSYAFTLFGPWLVPELPFEPRFLLEGARLVLAAAAPAGVTVIAIGGYSELGHVEAALAEGFAGVQMARALIREPDLVARWLASVKTGQEAEPSRCIHCNTCVLAALTPDVPARCPERPPVDVEDLVPYPN